MMQSADLRQRDHLPSHHFRRESHPVADALAGDDTGGHDSGQAVYMSPEQARRKPVDRRADNWAFGATPYELLMRRHLYGGGETGPTRRRRWCSRNPTSAHLPAATGGGTQPRLRRDGKEQFNPALDGKMMAVDVKLAPRFEAGIPHALFDTHLPNPFRPPSATT